MNPPNYQMNQMSPNLSSSRTNSKYIQGIPSESNDHNELESKLDDAVKGYQNLKNIFQNFQSQQMNQQQIFSNTLLNNQNNILGSPSINNNIYSMGSPMTNKTFQTQNINTYLNTPSSNVTNNVIQNFKNVLEQSEKTINQYNNFNPQNLNMMNANLNVNPNTLNLTNNINMNNNLSINRRLNSFETNPIQNMTSIPNRNNQNPMTQNVLENFRRVLEQSQQTLNKSMGLGNTNINYLNTDKYLKNNIDDNNNINLNNNLLNNDNFNTLNYQQNYNYNNPNDIISSLSIPEMNNQLNYNIQNNNIISSSNNLNTNNINPTNTITNNLNLDNNLDLLKLQNQVLNKSNLDLKNYNRCLKIELNSYKKLNRSALNNNPDNTNSSNSIPLSQYDNNVSLYIDTLKTSLNTSQMSNMELNELLKGVQNKNNELQKQNKQFKEEIEKINSNTKENKEPNIKPPVLNNEILSKCKELEENNEKVKKEIEEINAQINEQKLKNKNLQNIVESFNQGSYSNEESNKINQEISSQQSKNSE